MTDLSQQFRLLRARMTHEELLDAIGDVLYERGDLGVVLEEVLQLHNNRISELRRHAAEQARASALREMSGG